VADAGDRRGAGESLRMEKCRWCDVAVEDDDAVAVVTGEYAGTTLHRQCLDDLRKRSLAELKQLSTDF